MDPISRKPISRIQAPKLNSSRTSEQTSLTSLAKGIDDQTQNKYVKYCPHATLLLKSFIRIKADFFLKTAFTKLKNQYVLLKTNYKQGCSKLSKVMNNCLHSNKITAFARVFICEANRSQIRKRELVTKNKALFLRLWRRVNQLVCKKITEAKMLGINKLSINNQGLKTHAKLQNAHWNFLSLFFKQKLRGVFQTLKNNPLNFSKRATLYFSSLQGMMKTKIKGSKINAFQLMKKIQTKKEQFQFVNSGEMINDRQKQLKQQLEELIRQNKDGEQAYTKDLIEYETKKQTYQAQLEQLRTKNSNLQVQISQLQQNHKETAVYNTNEIKVYQSIYNNMLNFVHSSPQQMNKDQLIKSLLIPMSQRIIPVDIIKMQNQCLQQLLQNYSKSKLKIPQPQPVDTLQKANRNTYQYLIKQNSDLYGILSLLIQNSKTQRNDSEYNQLLNSFVDIEDKFNTIYSKVTAKK